jgi:hypothetical protein
LSISVTRFGDSTFFSIRFFCATVVLLQIDFRTKAPLWGASVIKAESQEEICGGGKFLRVNARYTGLSGALARAAVLGGCAGDPQRALAASPQRFAAPATLFFPKIAATVARCRTYSSTLRQERE